MVSTLTTPWRGLDASINARTQPARLHFVLQPVALTALLILTGSRLALGDVIVQYDFQESKVDLIDGRLRLRAATIGTDDKTVKFQGVRTAKPVSLRQPFELSFELDWSDQANGCYLTTGSPPDRSQRRLAPTRHPWACRETPFRPDSYPHLTPPVVSSSVALKALDALPRLLTLAAGQTARLLNVAHLAAPFQLSRPAVRDYVTVLEGLFLLEKLPPWHSNRMSRLIKTPKLHLGDTGLVTSLLGVGSESVAADRALLGQLLETFVFQELRRHASWHEEPITFHHFRDKDKVEVDLVLERGGRVLAGVEVKAAATVRASDFRGLRKLREATGDRFAAGVALHDGEATAPFGERLFAVPVRRLWEAH